jgi:pimeloyl-ACP methyl ester carboxylesterase
LGRRGRLAGGADHPERVKRLVIVNAPHPLVFQKSLIEDSRRSAPPRNISRTPSATRRWSGDRGDGLETFYEKTFGSHADLARLPAEEKAAYLDDWSQPGALTAMLNWYRASKIEVPAPGEEAKAPLWTHAPFPNLRMPTLVIWGLKDKALLPVQLEGLDAWSTICASSPPPAIGRNQRRPFHSLGGARRRP